MFQLLRDAQEIMIGRNARNPLKHSMITYTNNMKSVLLLLNEEHSAGNDSQRICKISTVHFIVD